MEPPVDLGARVEATLVNLTELAADELEAWELGAMRDPRNWARPAGALVIGASAGTALGLLRVRARQRQRAVHAHGGRNLAARTVHGVAEELRRALG